MRKNMWTVFKAVVNGCCLANNSGYHYSTYKCTAHNTLIAFDFVFH